MSDKTAIDRNERYARQTVLPQIGEEGQRKLHSAKVLLVGAGGLGCPAAQYLTGAGVGTIGIIDSDVVSLSNLQRQILYRETEIGQNKANTAAGHLKELNGEVEFVTYPIRLTEENAQQIIADYDFVIDAVDNFTAKYLISDTCVKLKKPFCHGGILQFHGQIMTCIPGMSPCYRGVFPTQPSDVRTCVQAGVIGAVAGVIGCMQAMEAIKYLTGCGSLLTGRLFTMDLLEMESYEVPVVCRLGGSCRECKDCQGTCL